jgi:hypothetical protein
MPDLFTAFIFAIPIGAGFTIGLLSVHITARKLGIKF